MNETERRIHLASRALGAVAGKVAVVAARTARAMDRAGDRFLEALQRGMWP